MPANNPKLVIGGNGAGEMFVSGQSLGCVTGNLQVGKRRNIRDYQTLCDALDGVAQGTPGQLTITGQAEVEFVVDGPGINAAENAIDTGAVVPVRVVYKAQGGASKSRTFQAFIDDYNESVSPGAPTGTVRVSFRAIAQS